MMDHQISQPDCPVWIKEELGDDSAQTVENQSTDECDKKELDLPCINITPIDTNQMEICKTEDCPKVKLDPNDMCYPLNEPSERPSVRCGNASSGDCLETTKEHPPRTSRVQTDDGFDQLVEQGPHATWKPGILLDIYLEFFRTWKTWRNDAFL